MSFLHIKMLTSHRAAILKAIETSRSNGAQHVVVRLADNSYIVIGRPAGEVSHLLDIPLTVYEYLPAVMLNTWHLKELSKLFNITITVPASAEVSEITTAQLPLFAEEYEEYDAALC